ncbi:uncharacterized protein BXZ73DRAFT_84615 [Epithele typhae]|uniref:uncharacterized protein n=1 Tax=Epithele typhae TaxID=378194 RepID=UPI002008DC5F|nr:uncharacterized protein BXZ73DRAFT_84615 [Epithele typhae]KAH9907129.1 hypothetical protein BXZ73DRAFT_84615 [Epithele typhae]
MRPRMARRLASSQPSSSLLKHLAQKGALMRSVAYGSCGKQTPPQAIPKSGADAPADPAGPVASPVLTQPPATRARHCPETSGHRRLRPCHLSSPSPTGGRGGGAEEVGVEEGEDVGAEQGDVATGGVAAGDAKAGEAKVGDAGTQDAEMEGCVGADGRRRRRGRGGLGRAEEGDAEQAEEGGGEVEEAGDEGGRGGAEVGDVEVSCTEEGDEGGRRRRGGWREGGGGLEGGGRRGWSRVRRRVAAQGSTEEEDGAEEGEEEG